MFHQTLIPKWIAIALATILAATSLYAAEVTLDAPDDLRDDLVSASTLLGLDDDAATDGQSILSSAKADYQRLISVLYSNGYFAPVINIRLDGREAASFPPIFAPDVVNTVQITVQSGPVFTFGKTDVGPLAPDTDIPVAFMTGQTADVSVLRQTAGIAVDGWRAVGHATARVGGQQITARHPDRKLDASIRIAPGPVLRFGTLTIEGNEDVRADRIAAIADFPAGKIYSPDQLKIVTARLRRIDAFRSVAVQEADEIGPNDTLGVNVAITENLPRRVGFGAEVSSLNGFSTSAFWLHRNLFGGAERLRFDAEINGIGGSNGGADYRLVGRFERPATFNADTHFYAQTSLERMDETLFFSDSFDVEAGILRIASEERQYELGVGYKNAQARDDFGERSFQFITVPLQATFDYRDDKLDATSGFYLNARLTPFAGISGNKSGMRVYGDARAYYTLGDDHPVTLAGRFQIGSLIGPDVDEAFPDMLFYSGGSGTVRGHAFQSLGVTLPSGEDVGGTSFIGLSTEARVKITNTLGVVGFFDAGYIGDSDVGISDFGRVQTGAGLGVRYDTGIGPIRLDMALPVSGPNDASGIEVYIGIGQAF
ncbi:MAG: autotransporter assembly complex protein TamA [Planktomarina sp.]